MNDELEVGRIAGLFGVQGELKCDPTRAGRALFVAGETLRASLPAGASQTVKILTVRQHKGRLLVRFEGASTPDEAARFTGATLHAERERIALDSNEFLDRDLTGCELYDSGNAAGTVERVEHYPASDMLVVRGKFVPLIAEFIRSIDVEKKRIDAILPAGMLDD